MTITALLFFMVVSQIAMAGYMLYTFNSLERAARTRNAEMRSYIEAQFADLERRLNGTAVPVRKRVAGEN